MNMKNGTRASGALIFFLVFLCGTAPVLAADINSLMQRAIKLYEMGEYEKALKQLNKVIKVDPDHAAAREYQMRCSQKIVESRLGPETAETLEKEINADKEAQKIYPESPTLHTSPDPKSLFSPDEAAFRRAMAAPPPPLPEPPAPVETVTPPATLPGLAPEPEKEMVHQLPWTQTPSTQTVPSSPSEGPGVNASTSTTPALPVPPLLSLPPETSTAPNAKDILDQRNTLSRELRRRYVGKENIVQLHETGRQIEVIFYLNRLFLPYSDALRADAYPVLDHVISRLALNPKRKVLLKAVDPVNQHVGGEKGDLSSKRTSIIFSYVLYSTLRSDDSAFQFAE